jgi:hypothetical protein
MDAPVLEQAEQESIPFPDSGILKGRLLVLIKCLQVPNEHKEI